MATTMQRKNEPSDPVIYEAKLVVRRAEARVYSANIALRECREAQAEFAAALRELDLTVARARVEKAAAAPVLRRNCEIESRCFTDCNPSFSRA